MADGVGRVMREKLSTRVISEECPKFKLEEFATV